MHVFLIVWVLFGDTTSAPAVIEQVDWASCQAQRKLVSEPNPGYRQVIYAKCVEGVAR